ncbi:endonuclease domain-containing 1 protein-like [Megalobrama amblycephala]|uniref:endonuclease domain-containing 1 protein-like n=1 Tax=Megalobrama amblycephala TaxID=75352 RepID=UPI002013FADE|nr:endonuclease domain-containing 1 protein-like [Megalobrama amblycephala]XP_048053717.1 endonuclease domain-containing 1 protein-like [Megalobrama amblycephala]XP_048053718.1 endonuclease domain-containing 1 protein-like [Megalobrama amblycephala]
MTLFLHVLMLFLLSGGSAKVVQNFEQECGQFFANGKSPTRFSGSQYRQICQTLNDVHYYATYYDTQNRIPVYSAYKFEGIKKCNRLNKWHTEPQLDDNKAGQNMEFQRISWRYRGLRQALNRDYVKSGFHRGHLAPVYQARSQDCADATFTLTNAAPQYPSFNSGQWWNEEERLAKDLKRQCQHVYIVTGVVPGKTFLDKKIKRVNVPSHFWTAYCCLDHKDRCSHSGGIIGTNDKKSKIRRMTVADLEEELQKVYRTTFRVFR